MNTRHGIGVPVVHSNMPVAIGFASLVFIVLGDILLYTARPGWTLGVFGLFVLCAIFLRRRLAVGSRMPDALLAGAIVTFCLRCFFEPAPAATVSAGIGLIVLARGRCEGWHASAILWAKRLASAVALGAVRLCGFVCNPLVGLLRSCAGARLDRWCSRIFAFCVFLFFLLLFLLANPILDDAANRWIGWAIARGPAFPSAWRIALWFAVAAYVTTALQPPTNLCEQERRYVRANGSLDGFFAPESLFQSLVMFNVLFAVQTFLDLKYLWGDGVLPADVSYAAYAHRGAYALALAASLAAGFASAAFRSAGSGRGPRTGVRILLLLWIAQAFLLVASAALRLWLYVDAYSLTRSRWVAAVWMVLVACGLISIAAHVALRFSVQWLVRVNGWTVAMVLYGCSMFGADSHIASFNVRHCREMRGIGHKELDAAYLERLGPHALPALIWLTQKMPDHAHAPRWRLAIASLVRSFDPERRDWRGWTWWRMRTYEEVRRWEDTEHAWRSFVSGYGLPARPPVVRLKPRAGEASGEAEP